MTDLRKAAEGAFAVMTAKPSSMTSADWKAAIDALRAALEQPKQDWSMLEAAKESLREHMTEIHRLRSVNAELLEALNWIAAHDLRGADLKAGGWMAYGLVHKARAAINKAREPKP
jgi:hypothetical protein